MPVSKRKYSVFLFIVVLFNAYAQTITCPEISSIRMSQKNTWFVPGENWQSSSFSFAEGLKRFVGAYWVGAQYGVMTCMYEPILTAGKEVFNIELLNSDLFALAADNAFEYEPRTSRFYCYSQSGSVDDCPFFRMGDETPLTEDQIFEQLSYQFSTHNIF